MTGPATRGTERGTRAPTRLTGTLGAVGAVLVVLALGLVLRLIIARLLPGSGFEVDLNAFRFWASNLASEGLNGFYDRDFFHDYTPGYLYVLWLVGLIGNAAGGVGDLIKIPPILADLAIGWLVWSMVRELGGRDRLALAAAAVAVLNPITWFDSVVWGQADSFGVVFVLLGLRELWRDRPERAAIYTVIAAIIKPQLGILIPLVAVVTIRRALWPAGGRGDAERTGHPVRILTTGLAGFVTAVVLCLPFGLSVVEFSSQPPFVSSGLLQQVAVAAGGYPYLTVNAYNPWALVPGDLGSSLANAGLWVCDYAGTAADCGSGTAVFGPLPAVVIGTTLLVVAIVLILWVVARRPDRLTILVGLAVLALAFFVVPTRVHERYGYPFFAMGVILAAISVRWRLAYLVLSVATFANMYVVLTTLYPDNPSIADWLGIGPAIRSEAGVVLFSLLHAAAFAWALVQLRSGARERLEHELALASIGDEEPHTGPPLAAPPPARDVPGASGPAAATMAVVPPDVFAGPPEAAAAPAVARASAALEPAAPVPTAATVATAATLPTWSTRPTLDEVGVVGWLRARLGDAPIRPDRTAVLRVERGGRLDRLDLWLLVLLVVGTLVLRTFRLAEPYQMHFDEVYHARTATEFLQSWRYGLPHDIYEWTHPHLAKYVMAGGLVVWGGDDVAATSELDVPVRAVAIEPRRTEAGAPSNRAGERLFVATGTEVRVFDLRSRDQIAVAPAPGATALAVDDAGRQLVVGYEDGRLATIDLGLVGEAGADLAPVELATADHPVTHLFVAADGGSVVAASDERLTSVDLVAGSTVGSLDLPDIADLGPGGSGSALVADVDEIADPAAVASALAEILSTSGADYLGQLEAASPGTTVVLGDPGSGDQRTALDAAIADGELPGIRVDTVTRTAVATADGVAFVDAGRASLISTTRLDGGAHGLAFATGLDSPKLFVTSGTEASPGYDVIVVGGDAAKNGPVNQGNNPLPAPGTSVAFDEATQMIHILGLAPDATDAGPWTVYVVQAVGNPPAVFADARLPDGFVPTAWAADFNPTYPSEDRQQLLVFDADGTSQAIDTGSHAFAWRLPGVIAGAITAALLYLLARILFQRRSVAALVGLFVIADGMFFVQSRIGMNDVYVGLFIIAAYTVFAALWTGWWRGRAAFWVGMPVIGVLLGLALASKWVAAYAIGALLLLVLVRSALGRVTAILGMIGLTTVLGYMAISVPAAAGSTDPGFGNLTFLLIMVALTLLAVVVAVVHPIAWTDDEMRFAIGAPVVLGALVFFGTLATGRLDTEIVIGSLAITPLLVAMTLASTSIVVAGLFWLAGRWGFGPLAVPPAPDDPIRLLEPPGAPAEGWLRPGSLAGIPVAWMAVCLIALPLVVYVVSYIPWAFVEDPPNQIIAGWPTGHTGQTLLDLTWQMYGYHNGLTAAHPASSPWWAWPMNLKPVWFYQEGLAAGTSAALYDAGSLVIWWMGIPAVAFVAWMAFRRRSLALTLIAIGFAAQWIPWARIDRAAFQYHYYTALPFVVLALAYFAAELWHGASRHTWALARIAAAIAIVAPAAMWLLHRPLCAIVGVDTVNPGSAACPAVIPDFTLTLRTAAQAVVVGVGLIVIIFRFLAFDGLDREDADEGRMTGALRSLVVTGIVVAAALVGASLLPDTTILTLTNIPVEPIAFVIGIPLAYLGLQVVASRDARRFVVGLGVAVVAWFAILYPNISALPLPSAVVAAYQGILPTYLYAFQFPVSTVTRATDTPLFTPMLALLLIALTVTCVVVAYSAWVWRVALAERTADAALSEDAEGLARSGGGA